MDFVIQIEYHHDVHVVGGKNRMIQQPEPVGWKSIVGGKFTHSELLVLKNSDFWEPVYTRTQVRKGFNNLATHLANQPTHCFCDVEARRRAKEW